MNEISIKDSLNILRKNLFKIIISIILFSGIAFGITKFIPEKYVVQTSLLLGVPESYKDDRGIAMEDINLNQKLISTYEEFIKSRRVSNQVIENLQLDMSYESLRNRIKISSASNSSIIKVVVTDTIPLRAKDIANEVSDVFMGEIKEAMNIDNVEVIDYAILPERAVSPNLFNNTIIGGLLGLMLSIFVVFLREALNTTVKSKEDIEKITDIPVIGQIPYTKG